MPRHHTIWDAVQQKQIDVPFTAEEETAKDAEESTWASEAPARAYQALRDKRDQLLTETDWWASSDLSITQAQKDYRKALRDLPANTADPTDITWPTKPS